MEASDNLLGDIISARSVTKKAGKMIDDVVVLLSEIEHSFRLRYCSQMGGKDTGYLGEQVCGEYPEIILREKCENAIKWVKRMNEVAPKTLDEIMRDRIPREEGIYIFWGKESLKPIYAGVALGNKGLSQRIRQHLKGPNRQSVLRRKISKDMAFSKEDDCTKYILNFFTLSYLPMPDVDHGVIRLAELLLILLQRPKYNRESQSPAEEVSYDE